MKSLFVITALFFCSLSQAHPGHDHQHWLSNPIHILTTIAIICIIAFTYKIVKQYKANKMEEK